MTPLPKDSDTLLTKQDLMSVLGCGDDVFKEMQDAGGIPEPTMYVGKTPRWRAGLIRLWIRFGGPRVVPKSSDKSGKRPISSDSDG